MFKFNLKSTKRQELMSLKAILVGDIRPDLLKDETLAAFLSLSAKQFPGKTALIFGDQMLTYEQVDKWSDAVAADLLGRGIGSGSKVGLWYPRSLELHMAVLGIIKAGAAYVPLDYDMPKKRVEGVLQDVEAAACFTLEALEIPCPVIQVTTFPDKPVALPELKSSPDDIAFILYTSGSTGKPKGIPITQRQICHLVRAEQSILGIQSCDKVYQGVSVSFDMWCQETWIGYLAGATLFVADNATAKAIDELSDVLRKNEITVFHAVPSLLACMDSDIPSLRLVNSGGEACTPQVLKRWASGNRLFFNSYGPTEITVISSMIALKPEDTITIGYPLPNYNCAIVDTAMNLLPCGSPGELIVTGPGVGMGYIGLPELTAAKFVPNLENSNGLPGSTIYKTGDLAIINANGTIELLGRMDDQIKLRGYRIELGEIENQLTLPGVKAAAVALKKDNNEEDQLVGYVVLNNKNNFDEQQFREHLNKVLPPYMVPVIILAIDEMPRLSSGKINRNGLPLPLAFTAKKNGFDDETINPEALLSDRVLIALQYVFPERKIDLSMDFFTDLGGHSLLAARLVSKLRKEGGIKSASLKDVYLHRPLSELVGVWATANDEEPAPQRTFNKVPWWRFYACWAMQTIAVGIIYGLFAAQIFLPYLGYYYVKAETGSYGYALIASLVLFCFIPPVLSLVTVILKWLIIGKIKEGEYPLWGTYYFRWWFVTKIQALLPLDFLNGTPLYPLFLKMKGLKVAYDAQLSSFQIGAEDLVTIGKDASISSNVVLNNVVVEDGMIKFSKISIGDHAYIGSNIVIAGGSVIEDWGELKDLSYLKKGQVIRQREVWKGSPARYIETKTAEELPQPPIISMAKKVTYYIYFFLLLLIFPFAFLLPLFPIILIITYLGNDHNDFRYLIATPALALLYMILFAVQTIIISRLLQRNLKPGVYSVYSPFYIRKWLADQLMALSLLVMHPVYASVYIAWFFKALGAKIGKNTEISTASSVTHPLLEIGKGSFIADVVSLGEADIRAQSLILARTQIGDNCFVGNSALIPQGYKLNSNMLIGVLSSPPTIEQMETDKSRDWFGSPAISLPKRQDSGNYDPSLTTTPGKKRFFARATIELIRILIPQTVLFSASILFINYVHDLLVENSLQKFIALFPIYYLAIIGIPCFLLTVILKWIFIGRYKPGQMPLWTWGVWRTEAITAIYESLTVPFLFVYLRGTPWLPFMLKFFGAKTGKKVWLDTTDITEFDMLSIGDDTAFNLDCGAQTHLFEDRVMKVGDVNVRSQTSVGAKTIILYNTDIGDNVHIDPLSLVMKGENIPDHTSWGGNPVISSR
jgi:non-ribosomal peptide synthetase-like protein